MKAAAVIIAIIALALSAGCATDPHVIDAKAAIPPLPPPNRNLERAKPPYGSLFTASASDLFTDLRAKRPGDVIVVEIVENTKAKQTADSKAERKNTFKAGIPYLLGYEQNIPRASGGATTDPNIQADFDSKHDTKAENKREATMTTSIGCTVIEVLAGGNLLIRGSREVHVNGETENVTLQGIVRPSDVTTSNTVLSTQIADARIYYTGRGVLSDKQRPGWLARLLDNIWPF